MAFVRAFGAIIALAAVLSIFSRTVHAQSLFFCPTGFANFGDSLTDTANALDAFPFTADAENPPYGETFFKKPSKRFCNGRLVPDFFSLAFLKPLLDGYFSVTTFDYRFGLNFAVAGATAALSTTAITPFSVYPFQFNQYIRFINSVQSTQLQPVCANFAVDLPIGVNVPYPTFPTWLYTIEAGGNDLINAFQNNTPVATIQSTVIPAAISAISITIQGLYALGARHFLIFGVPAQGCATIILTLLGNQGFPTDNLGCIIFVDQTVQVFNSGLLAAIQSLRNTLSGATISFFDYYSANVAILSNPTLYGFNPALTKTACCGAGGVGTLNYNPAITCGRPGSNNCQNPDQYVNWDGVHFTEAFYRVIAQFALTGSFTDQGVNYSSHCGLDFSKFGSTVTYQQAYPFACQSIFA